MKIIVALVVVTTMTASAFITHRATARRILFNVQAEHFAEKVLDAFRRESAESFKSLYPTLDEFHQLMNSNASFYGNYLADAKQDFEDNYVAEQLPGLLEAFEHTLAQGEARGIVWKDVKYQGIEVSEKKTGNLGSKPFTIVFLSNGKRFRMCIQRAFQINGQWKPDRHIKLEQ